MQSVCVFSSTECGGYKRHAMSERQNTFVCPFEPQSPQISAHEIHVWIYETLCLRESELVEYRHTNCVISKVSIEAVGLGLRKVRIANLPPEVSDRNIGWPSDNVGRYMTYKVTPGQITTVTQCLMVLG